MKQEKTIASARIILSEANYTNLLRIVSDEYSSGNKDVFDYISFHKEGDSFNYDTYVRIKHNAPIKLIFQFGYAVGINAK